jgi:hypothetical protein
VRLLVISSSIPHAAHDRPDVSAVEIVIHELLSALSDIGYHIVLQPVFNLHRRTSVLAEHERADVEAMERRGIQVLSAISHDAYMPRGPMTGSRLARGAGLLMGRPLISGTYPARRLRPTIRDRIASAGVEAILTVWSPEGVAAATGSGRPVIAYQGDVDFVPAEVRYRHPELFPHMAALRRSVGSRLKAELWLREFRWSHLALMGDVDVVANVTASNARFYADHGHRRSVYARNVWRTVSPPVREAPRALDGSVRIVGHAGRLDTTGSTFGLSYLLRQVLPALERELRGIEHRVEIIGSGEVSPALRSYLDHPRIQVRGFVDDLDEVLRTSAAYLLLNNAGPYRAAFTRHLVAWSIGACLVVHANSREAIPEIAPGANALVGEGPEEIARLVRAAITRPQLALSVRAGGRKTYEAYFRPALVAQDLDREIRWATGRSAARR